MIKVGVKVKYDIYIYIYEDGGSSIFVCLSLACASDLV
jgi:hypothetical protein